MTNVYPVIKNGTVQLWNQGWSGPRCTVTHGAVSAVLYGRELVVTRSDGLTTVYTVTPNGSNAYPTRNIR